MNKEVQDLLRRAEQNGGKIERLSRHYRVTAPSGETMSVPGSPSDRRWYMNARAKMKQMGLWELHSPTPQRRKKKSADVDSDIQRWLVRARRVDDELEQVGDNTFRVRRQWTIGEHEGKWYVFHQGKPWAETFASEDEALRKVLEQD